MIVTRETSLEDFEFWGGAEETAAKLTSQEMAGVESALMLEYPNGMDETELNDLFRFDEKYVYVLAGKE